MSTDTSQKGLQSLITNSLNANHSIPRYRQDYDCTHCIATL